MDGERTLWMLNVDTMDRSLSRDWDKAKKVKKYEDIPMLLTRFECTAYGEDKRVSLEECNARIYPMGIEPREELPNVI